MKKFLIVFPYLINLFFVNPLSIQPSYPAEVNCNSPVWKNKPLCLKKQKKIREAKECLLQKDNNLEIKTYKGTNLFKSIKCLPIEEKIVFKTLKLSGQVIALGGGSFLNNKIRSEILKNSFSFWFKCETKPKTI